MSDNAKPSRRRGLFKNSLVWGAAWGTLGFGVATLMRLGDKIPFVNAVLDGVGMGIRIGVMGAIAGAVFSTFISLAYRGKNLSEISWVRFGLGGLVLAGVFVPGFLQTMHFLSDGTLMPWNLISDDFVYSALFGGITAAGTMKLAQHGEALNPETPPDSFDRIEQNSLNAGGAPEYSRSQSPTSAKQYHV